MNNLIKSNKVKNSEAKNKVKNSEAKNKKH